MNYVLQLNEKSVGWPRYYLNCGGITPNIGEAFSTKMLHEARQVRGSKHNWYDKVKIIEVTDKQLFEYRLRG